MITLTTRLSPSALDTRRGVVRLHPEVLDALGLRAWDAVRLTGARVSAALAAAGDGPPGVVLVDDVTLSNLGIVEGSEVVVAPTVVTAARAVTVAGSRLAATSLTPETLRMALTGKVLTVGDAVSLLPQDLAPPPGADVGATRSRLSNAIGMTWTNELVTITAVDPAGPVAVQPSTVVGWRDGPRTGAGPVSTPAPGGVLGPVRGRGDGALGSGLAALGSGGPGPIALGSAGSGSAGSGSAGSGSAGSGSAGSGRGGLGAGGSGADGSGASGGGAAGFGGARDGLGQGSLGQDGVAGVAGADGGRFARNAGFVGNADSGVVEPGVGDLVGQRDAIRRLGEWFDLSFTHPELLARLGAAPGIAALVSGPEGVGKATLVRAVAREAGAAVVEVASPGIAVLEANATAARLAEAIDAAHAVGGPVVLLLTDVEALLPAASPPPVATIVLDALRTAVSASCALVVTSAHPESIDPRLRVPDLVDREIVLPLPDGAQRTELLRVLFRDVPIDSEVDFGAIADRTPGFVAADLIALRRESAVQAALRQRKAEEPQVAQEDLLGALDTVRPISMSTSDTLRTGGLTLDDVGDMVEVKQALTEAALWPLQYPDSFARLGVAPPRGLLMYGPPGCGKTFLVRALAGSGRLNVLSVKGAELMDKFVGESERAVRELFRRAAEAAPALVFLDEVDALAPRRGQSSDSGVADRVVAALLTELDGVEPLRDVVVLGATNRPELVDPALLRPGRLERLVYVPPPDADARTAILRAAARNTPLADVDLGALAADLDGYSAADCAALIREAALTAMRESLEATVVTADHLAAARAVVRPSLDPAQLASLAAYAESRR
ncbi:transitional endoplasmic reticulum ATPase [Saccharothrix violaceirubra]|uniref:Transitional endoplasmic reticulum ATPase n=1 Tax=Saccharothrix violaceirubra TaxID=413306 RepID=A0A7W7WZ02_9PSEU|nr:transitional endoplasmic reticulum ATPase [Saccharothrix violaceirubra]